MNEGLLTYLLVDTLSVIANEEDLIVQEICIEMMTNFRQANFAMNYETIDVQMYNSNGIFEITVSSSVKN